MFSKTVVNINKKHYKPFGCPVYVLDSALQASAAIHDKWKERARIGVYLGQSPLHPRNVALVLDVTTGLVSPQFHVKFDPSFSRGGGGRAQDSMERQGRFWHHA